MNQKISNNQPITREDLFEMKTSLMINLKSEIKEGFSLAHTNIANILEAMHYFAESVDERFNTIDQKFEKVDNKLETIEKRLTKVESTIVTKDYLDEKLADLRGDMVVLIRKEDTKLKTLVNILQKKDVVSEDEAKQVFKMEPFSQI